MNFKVGDIVYIEESVAKQSSSFLEWKEENSIKENVFRIYKINNDIFGYVNFETLEGIQSPNRIRQEGLRLANAVEVARAKCLT